MIVLAVGDVVGLSGREFLKERLRGIKRELSVDFCVVNGENAAVGNGVDPQSAEDIFEAGADVITTGNHIYQKSAVYDYLDESPYIIRPANYADACPGRGFILTECVRTPVFVMNLMGTTFMDLLDNPFLTADRVLKEVPDEVKVRIVDFHAEATSEKIAMGFHLDGRVSAMFGTHTHVQTADEEVYPGGLGYISDVGMTGPVLSVLGIEPEVLIERFKTRIPKRLISSKNPIKLCGAVFDIDEETGKTRSVRRVSYR